MLEIGFEPREQMIEKSSILTRTVKRLKYVIVINRINVIVNSN
jgi:hypothetical protein